MGALSWLVSSIVRYPRHPGSMIVFWTAIPRRAHVDLSQTCASTSFGMLKRSTVEARTKAPRRYDYVLGDTHVVARRA